jgi:enoyl-CoA hydratase/carnithine racemase
MSEPTFAIGEGELRGESAAACLFASWLLLRDDASLILDTPAAWAAATWRLGGRAYRLWLDGTTRLDAPAALALGLADDVAADPQSRLRAWLGARSELALEVGATLIHARGGDPLERAAFGFLFAAGEPQEGLRAFLEKRAPRF